MKLRSFGIKMDAPMAEPWDFGSRFFIPVWSLVACRSYAGFFYILDLAIYQGYMDLEYFHRFVAYLIV